MVSPAVRAFLGFPFDACEGSAAGGTLAGDLCGRLDAEDAAHLVDRSLDSFCYRQEIRHHLFRALFFDGLAGDDRDNVPYPVVDV